MNETAISVRRLVLLLCLLNASARAWGSTSGETDSTDVPDDAALVSQGWQVAKIEKGRHFTAEVPYRLLFGKKVLRYQMRFDTTFRCNVPQRDRYAINKVFGIGFLHHKLNSARLGWVFNPDTERLELWAYCYVNTRRRFKKLTEVEWNKLYDCALAMDYEAKTVTYQLREPNGHLIQHTVDYHWLPPIQYRLRPFFGGTKPASHDIVFRLKEVKE